MAGSRGKTKSTYEVERIVDVKEEGGVTMYLLKWKGLDEAQNSWEIRSNITKGFEALKEEFDNSRNSVPQKRKSIKFASQEEPESQGTISKSPGRKKTKASAKESPEKTEAPVRRRSPARAASKSPARAASKSPSRSQSTAKTRGTSASPSRKTRASPARGTLASPSRRLPTRTSRGTPARAAKIPEKEISSEQVESAEIENAVSTERVGRTFSLLAPKTRSTISSTPSKDSTNALGSFIANRPVITPNEKIAVKRTTISSRKAKYRVIGWTSAALAVLSFAAYVAINIEDFRSLFQK